MIRALLVMAGLALGLGLAVATQGTMGHLRAMIPAADLPAWSARLDDGARLSGGRAEEITLSPLPQSAVLHWHLTGLDASGVHWTLRIEGDNGALSGQARATLAWRAPGTLSIDRGSLDFSPSALPAPVSGVALEGLLHVATLQAALRLPTMRLTQLQAQGEWRGARAGDTDLGHADLALQYRGDGWRLPISVDGPALAAQGRIEGRAGQGAASLTLRITARSDMPPEWARVLDRTGRRTQAGDGAGVGAEWEIKRNLNLGGEWPL